MEEEVKRFVEELALAWTAWRDKQSYSMEDNTFYYPAQGVEFREFTQALDNLTAWFGTEYKRKEGQ